MKTTLFLVSATTALFVNLMTNAYAYNNVYVFGDSLSDGGNNGRFTTDGKDTELYDEYIARNLTGKKIIPSKKDGTNYAYGGATANGSGDPFWDAFMPPTKKQLDDYLQAHSGRADPNGLYIHWVGGNDVKDALQDLAKGDEKAAQHRINDSSASAASQINQLIKAGAGLIIVPNVPDIGTTPQIMEAVLRGALKKSKIPDGKIAQILKQAHEAINKYPTPNKEIRNKILQEVFKKIAEGASPQDPEAAKEIYRQLLDAYDNASKTASQFSDEFNQNEENQLINGNILRADVNHLLREVIENPTIYGIANTLGYACPQGTRADLCFSSQPGFDKSQPYLFSDDLHPTPYAHKVIGQYIMSIYNAPLQVMALNHINRTSTTTALSSLEGHLQQLRNNHQAKGKIGVFAGYTGNHNNTITLGSDYQLTDNLLLGATISRYKDEQNATPNFNYAAIGHVITAYTLWNYYGNGWLNGDVHYSRTNYDNLSRSIQLGQATRRESGSTMGRQWGWQIAAGWNIPITPYLTTSPIIQYSWDKGDIDGYRETGNNSTSMHFAAQNYHSKVGSVGWRVDTKLGRFNPYASILFNHQFDDERYTLRSAINATKTSFVQQGEKQNRDHIQYTVGVNANLTNDFRAFAAVSHEKNDNEPNHDYYFNLGFNVNF
ncbi:autotransporter outer membrane beta-barrel domain-containing protein [Xenorhabdus griffiniae]|uniref:SGNH/GDSL hydrolase family protein n=1 Tax=Xenorhabdus griffiniae TaxID=351672 RepID=A0ABY9XD34_9GAMM|nr:autotransporter domain-containing protein [Xenorhabdus griffiniae]MBD1228103.1 autotransporter domain-containing protein [Xenorhabdus griffiniae]MBE8587249.1 autotransporter domain-containing protein [Xenorhabdus griffiniae]WMV70794.1 SGNH/GDSL hydrolase family protein [Xenorhabdus griffiniae]WNH00470.1 SGNH/GDSL hydrolase family protein [Xenorhabdus griffiniae]